MKFKKILTKLLFTKHQREVIYRSLAYSDYRYRKVGNVDKACDVQKVIDGTVEMLGVVPTTFTKSQVDEIVDRVVSEAVAKERKVAFEAGFKAGEKNVMDHLIPVGEIDLEKIDQQNNAASEKCADCEHKDNCPDCKEGDNNLTEQGDKTEDNNYTEKD